MRFRHFSEVSQMAVFSKIQKGVLLKKSIFTLSTLSFFSFLFSVLDYIAKEKKNFLNINCFQTVFEEL